MHDLLNAVVAGVLVALIAGIFSLVGMIVSKETKLSDFRQAWIDALREDVSLFVSHAINISSYFQVVIKPVNARFEKQKIDADQHPEKIQQLEEEHQRKLQAFLEALREDFSGLNTCSTRIKLRLNDNSHEVESNRLLREMEKLEAVFIDISNAKDKEVHNIVEEIESTSRPLLKKEWERVKRGELTFRIAKWASLALSSLLIILVLSFAISAPAYLYGYFSASGHIPQQQKICAQVPSPVTQQIEVFPNNLPKVLQSSDNGQVKP